MGDESNANVGGDITMNKQKIDEAFILPNFSGAQDDISVESWLLVYEKMTEGWNDNERKKGLFRYFKGLAFEYIAMEDSEANFEKIKTNPILRFGKGEIDPAIEFSRVVYKPEIGIQVYFNEKRRLGIQAGMRENNIVSFMIDGLPYELKQVFTGLNVREMAEFFSVAKKAERNWKEKLQRDPKPSTSTGEGQRFREKGHNFKKNLKAKKLPPFACRICNDLGYPGRFHWMSDCKNKGKKAPPKKNEVSKNLN